MASQQSATTSALLSRIHDLENHSHQPNLLYYGIPDVEGGTQLTSEQKVLQLANNTMGVAVLSSHVERASNVERGKQGQSS